MERKNRYSLFICDNGKFARSVFRCLLQGGAALSDVYDNGIFPGLAKNGLLKLGT